MSKVLATLLLSALAVAPAVARGHGYAHSYSYRSHASASTSAHYYTNVDGNRVHRPMMSSSRPAGASAHCADGSWSFSQHARGTCSHHGGVASW